MIKLPKPGFYKELKDWAEKFVSTLEDKFARETPEDKVGRIDRFAISLPEGYLPTDGSEFDVASAPDLARKLGSTFGAPSVAGKCKLPTIANSPANTVYGIRK